MTIDHGFGLWSQNRNELEERPKCIIRIEKIPEGPAAEEHRKAWVGLHMEAVKQKPTDRVVNPIEGKDSPPRAGFIVSRIEGLTALAEAGQAQAFFYFERNWPENIGFSFGADEAVIVQEL